ncbi:MAG: beta-galactosidase [Candidatus Schekmanbacteria bacterium]|nr:beta-galactosidase [Candidatus Schekmanbacteria bacterium]
MQTLARALARGWPGLATVIVALLASTGCRAPAPTPMKLFSLQQPDAPVGTTPPELAEPAVHGLSWRFRWGTIEPLPGEYHWERIDSAIQVTRAAGKTVMLRITAGMHTPDWVYDAGARAVQLSNTDLFHSENYKKQLTMAPPWDEVYLARWTAFIHALGERYGRDKSIFSIQMTGGGHIGELNLPKAPEKWSAAGYSDTKLIGAWKRIIDAYRESFPGIPTNLDINEPLRSSNVLNPLVDFVLAKYPGAVYLQHNGLRGDLPADHRIRTILRGAAGRTVVGYQMVGGGGFLEQQTGSRLEALRRATEDHASYLEVYAGDLQNAGLKATFRQFAETR